MADIGLVATRSYLVVVCEIDIEHELFGYRTEDARFAERFAITGVGGVDRANFKPRGVEAENIFSKAIKGQCLAVEIEGTN